MVRRCGENRTLFSVFNQAEEKKLKEYRETKVSVRVNSARYNVFVSDSDTATLEYLLILMSTSVPYFDFVEFVQMLLLLKIDRLKTACSKEATTVLKK